MNEYFTSFLWQRRLWPFLIYPLHFKAFYLALEPSDFILLRGQLTITPKSLTIIRRLRLSDPPSQQLGIDSQIFAASL